MNDARRGAGRVKNREEMGNNELGEMKDESRGRENGRKSRVGAKWGRKKWDRRKKEVQSQ